MDVTALYLPFKKEFEPIVRIGENVAIPKGQEKYEFYKVTYIEPVQPITVSVSLNALQKNYGVTLDSIELQDNEAGQWRLWIPDFVRVNMNFPKAVAKWTTKNEVTSATPLSMVKDQFLEFYTHKDDVPTLYIDNPVNESQLVRILIWGFKYSLKKLEYEPGEYTVFPAYSATYVIGGRG